MNSIDDTYTDDILNSDPVDLESCFDPLFYPPEDFGKTMDNQRREKGVDIFCWWSVILHKIIRKYAILRKSFYY